MRYLIGLLLAIVVIIIIIIKLLTGSGGNVAPKPTPLTDYADTDTVVRYVLENPVQSPQTHREVQITVGRDEADIVVYKGYDGAVVRSKTYPMSVAAYSDFLRGLLISGKYTSGKTDKSLRDERGYCATGERYVYEIIDGAGNELQHFWSTSCGDKTFQGSVDIVQQLFRNQIPDYDTLTNDVQL